MRVALISDLHGNLIALEAVLEEIKSSDVDQIVCLGDIASLGPQPSEVVSCIQTLGCQTIQGNHDPLEQGLPVLAELEKWTVEQLSERQLEFLRSLPSKFELSVGGKSLLCVHGSPQSFDDQILATTDPETLDSYLGDLTFDAMVCGHTRTSPPQTAWQDNRWGRKRGDAIRLAV